MVVWPSGLRRLIQESVRFLCAAKLCTMEFSGIVRCKSSNLLATIIFCNSLPSTQNPETSMVVIPFDSMYLANRSDQLVSKWSGEVESSNDTSAAKIDNSKALFLPPMKPEALQNSTQVIITLDEVEGPGDYNVAKLASQLKSCLQARSEFWNQLFYEVEFSNNGRIIQLSLTCQVWNSEKISTLLQKPAENRRHMANLPPLCFLKELRVNVDLSFSCEPHQLIDETWPQLNEYFGSLFISQLEFRFPFVFSAVARKRFLSQESAIGPISYALSDSSALLPILVKLISEDTTATTVYQMLKCSKSRAKRTSFQIAKGRDME